MKVRAIWEFDADVSDISPKHVDVEGLAIDLARDDLRYRRVVHLAYHARKARTRKKNYRRMIRICEKEKD